MFLHSFLMSLPYNTQAIRGFGLVELLVSISIMTLVSAVILARHSSYNSAVLLRNQAYEVAFTIREAQNYALSAVFTDTGTGLSTDSFRERYGVHFEAGNSVYYLFRDDNGDGGYDAGEEIGQPGRLDPRFVFSSVPGGTGVFDVMFERPNFDAIFDPNPSGPAGTPAIITVSTDTSSRDIEVTRTGQIAVLGN